LKPRFGGWLLPEVWQRRTRNKRKVKQTNKQTVGNSAPPEAESQSEFQTF